MPVVISLLRGINLAGHHTVKMDELRALYASLKLRDSQTYVQSGNVVFRTDEKDLVRLSKKIEEAIEQKFAFHADVVLRTTADLKKLVAKNPFANRDGIEPAKLAVTFLPSELEKKTCAQLVGIPCKSEEIQLGKRELFVYFPDGMGKSKVGGMVDKVLKKSGTFRNWNTVNKLLEMAEKMEKETGGTK